MSKKKIEIELMPESIVNLQKFTNISLLMFGEPFWKWCLDNLDMLYEMYLARLNEEEK